MWTPTTRRQHSRAGLRYGSDLTDAEWAILAPFLPAAAPCGRKRAYPMREIVNAMCYVLRGGIAWRLMPDCFPPWRTVYRWFARLRDDGTWQTINHHLVMRDRAITAASRADRGVADMGARAAEIHRTNIICALVFGRTAKA